jgi:hypothetical protein
MLLSSIIKSLSEARQLDKNNLANYRRATIYFSNYIGRDATLSDVTTSTVNGWLTSEQTTRQASYVRNLRRDFIVVWNFAADNELCTHPKTRLIRRPKFTRPSPRAWPIEWIPKLIAASSRLTGKIKSLQCSRADFCRAYLLVQIDLLCRPTDMRYMRWKNIKPDGTVNWVQHKTRRETTAKLSSDALNALNKLRGLDDMFCFPLSKSCCERLIRALFVEAGIEKPCKQSLGHLRHTGGTITARKLGVDSARAALGHAPDSTIFERHYYDQSKESVDVNSWWHG